MFLSLVVVCCTTMLCCEDVFVIVACTAGRITSPCDVSLHVGGVVHASGHVWEVQILSVGIGGDLILVILSRFLQLH